MSPGSITGIPGCQSREDKLRSKAEGHRYAILQTPVISEQFQCKRDDVLFLGHGSSIYHEEG